MDVFKTLLLDTPDSLNAITGTLQIANGGTGATDAAGARDNLLPDYTGNVGKVLTVNAGATDVEWTTNGAGTVTSVDLTAGTGVSVSGGPITSSGSITVTNTAPDQTVVLTAGTGISTSGTYPSFTVTNSAPDQTVAIAAGTGISVSGSYPSFTVTNSAPSLGGDVVGPASSTDNAVVRFDSTTGKLVQNSGVTISDADLLTTTDLTVNDDTVLGSSNADTVNFNARVASDINPATDNTYDLGVTGHEWRNLNIDGTANIDSLVADTADIDGGTIDGTTIGATTPSTVAATTITGTTSVKIGTSSSFGGTVGQLNGANIVQANGTGMVSIASTDAVAADKGGSLALGAKATGGAESNPYPMAVISGRAVNATDLSGYFAVATSNASGTIAERMRLTDTGLAVTGALSDTIGDVRLLPQNSQSTAYTLVLTDSGKHLLHPSADTTARTFTIPANGSVAYPIGTAITFVNQASAGVLTIAITTDTMRLAGAGTTGSRTLAANGIATALKVTSTEWIISGTGLT
jgi:hypothetical protein